MSGVSRIYCENLCHCGLHGSVGGCEIRLGNYMKSQTTIKIRRTTLGFVHTTQRQGFTRINKIVVIQYLDPYKVDFMPLWITNWEMSTVLTLDGGQSLQDNIIRYQSNLLNVNEQRNPVLLATIIRIFRFRLAFLIYLSDIQSAARFSDDRQARWMDGGRKRAIVCRTFRKPLPIWMH